MAEPHDTTVLRVGLLAPVDDVDPRGAWEMGRALVASQLFETPYAVGGGWLDAEPSLFDEPPAREPASAAGRPVFSARLAPGVRFSDGSELTAAEAAAILARSPFLAAQARIEARGERIFFELTRPNSRFDLALTTLDCAIVRRRGGVLVGTGPYALAPDSAAGEPRLVRNPFSRLRPALEEIRFRVFAPEPDGTPRRLLAALEAGEVDFTNVLSLEHQRGLRGVRRHSMPGGSTALLFMNTERLTEPATRLAIATAIDRRAIARQLYSDPITVANHTAKGLLPPMLGWSLDGIVYDLERARALLASSAAAPRKLTLLVIWSPRTYLPQPPEVAATLAAQLAELGLAVEIEHSTGAEDLTRRITEGRFDLYLGGWIADTPDPADFFEALLASWSIPGAADKTANQANFSRWRSDAADEALRRLRVEQGEHERSRMLREVGDQVPVFPLLYGPATAAHSRRLEGFTLSAIGHPSFAAMRLRG